MGAASEVTLVVHTQHQQTGRYYQNEGVEYGLRAWSCTVLDGRPKASSAHQLPYVKKVEFILHETFDNSHRVVSYPPYKMEEEGWGEFDLVVMVYFVNCPEPYKIVHDLNFHEGESYYKSYDLVVPNPSPGFLALFNKLATVSRKTIPARATKARKGPPRDSSTFAKSSRPAHHRHGYDSAASRNSDSDSIDSTSEDEVSDSRSSQTRSNKARSVSSVSADSAASSRKGVNKSHPRLADPGKRPIQAPKHMTQPDASSGRGATSTAEHHSSPHSRLAVLSGSSALRTTHGDRTALPPALPNEDSRHQRPNASAKPERDHHANLPQHSQPRKKRDPVPASGMRRPPNSHVAEAAVAKQHCSPTLPSRLTGTLDKPVPSANRTERQHATGSSGAKRRMNDASESAINRRQTLGAVDQLTSPSLAASIASVKVPKKKMAANALATSNGRDKRDEDVSPPSKRQRVPVVPARQSSLRSETDDLGDSRSSPTVGLSSRDAFVREREKNRMLERQRENGVVTSSTVRSTKSGTASGRAPRPAAAAPTAAKNGRSGTLAARNEVALSKGASKAASPVSIESRQRNLSPSSAPPPAQAKRTGPVDQTRKMERIMARVESLNDRHLVGFLGLLHKLRVEQDPDHAVSITEEAVDQVENDGEYACNLSLLNAEAIDQLWTFVKEVRA
ncbi:transcription factor TFIIF complex subunit Tfg3 [Coemansia sp. BCRC 34301]|nr:transcription factor TFIIF complex subunit Tfg3 [Coemansia sp. BCRC 34301]